MDRRDFLKKAGLGSLALASLPLAHALAAPALADDSDEEGGKTDFFFVVVSKLDGASDLIILNGTGRFGAGGVRGRGSFTHFIPGGSPPFPIVGSGTWKARKLSSFTPTSPPTYGAHAAGILEFSANLFPTGGDPIRGANMRVVCNIGPGGLQTGHHEGVTLTLPGGPTFQPLEPELGLTTFTPRIRRDEED